MGLFKPNASRTQPRERDEVAERITPDTFRQRISMRVGMFLMGKALGVSSSKQETEQQAEPRHQQRQREEHARKIDLLVARRLVKAMNIGLGEDDRLGRMAVLGPKFTKQDVAYGIIGMVQEKRDDQLHDDGFSVKFDIEEYRGDELTLFMKNSPDMQPTARHELFYSTGYPGLFDTASLISEDETSPLAMSTEELIDLADAAARWQTEPSTT